MPKGRRRLTKAEKIAKRERQRRYMWVFIDGKQKRVERPVMIDGLELDELIRRNADPIWLHQNEMWECIDADAAEAPWAASPQPAGRLDDAEVATAVEELWLVDLADDVEAAPGLGEH